MLDLLGACCCCGSNSREARRLRSSGASRFRRGSAAWARTAWRGREVELGIAAAEAAGGDVVGPGGLVGGVVRAEPDAGALVRVADLRRPLAPRPLPDAVEAPDALLLPAACRRLCLAGAPGIAMDWGEGRLGCEQDREVVVEAFEGSLEVVDDAAVARLLF